MKKKYPGLLLLIPFTLLTSLLKAQWSSNAAVNTAVCTATDKQVDLRMIKDDKGGAYITWKDYRNAGIPDIYIQRLNAAGIPKWTANGVALCTNNADQSTPAIISDGRGGAIVTWSDWRSGIERDLYAQRIDSNGLVQWAADGIVVSNKTAREHNPKIVSDDEGGAIIAWEQQTGGIWDIWAQRISANGTPMWAAGGIALCSINANRINPKIQEDGKGGAIIVWQDERNGNYDIYAQRVDKNGMLKWTASAKAICIAADVQTDPKIDPDTTNGGAYICWIDQRNGTDYDLYAQRIDSTGTPKWAATGVTVCTAAGNQTAQDILSNSATNGLIVTWKDKRNGSNYDIYAQKLNPGGVTQWTANGVAICTAAKDQLNPNIIQDMAGGAIIVWQDSSAGSYDIRAQRIDNNGAKLWAATGVDVGTATGDQVQPKNVPDGKGGSIFAFQDKRSGSYDIYAHHLYSDGTVVNGISDLTAIDKIYCYPNPFHNSITVTCPGSISQRPEIMICDVTGKLVEGFSTVTTRFLSDAWTIVLNASDHIPTGTYILKLNYGQVIRAVPIVKR